MKAIIDIIKADNNGQNDTIIARYNKDKEAALDVGIMDSMVPEVGEVLTNGQQDMTVTEHVVINGSVGIKFDAMGDNIVSAKQVVEMISNGSVKVK